MENQQQIDPSQYGYTDDAKVTISGALFEKIAELTAYVGSKESFIAFEQYDNLESTLSENNKAKKVMTPHGMLALSVTMALQELHTKNIEQGIAKHHEEINPPKITLEL